jgi:hypothetical protein
VADPGDRPVAAELGHEAQLGEGECQAGEKAVGPMGIGAGLQVAFGVVEPALAPGGQAEADVGELDAVLERQVSGEAQRPVVEGVSVGERALERGQAPETAQVVGDRGPKPELLGQPQTVTMEGRRPVQVARRLSEDAEQVVGPDPAPPVAEPAEQGEALLPRPLRLAEVAAGQRRPPEDVQGRGLAPVVAGLPEPVERLLGEWSRV